MRSLSKTAVLPAIVLFYLTVLGGWLWFSTQTAPNLILTSDAPAATSGTSRVIRLFVRDRSPDAALQLWREAIPLIAAALMIHLGIVLAIARRTGGSLCERTTTGVVIALSLPFLLGTIFWGAVQDYVLYLDIWRQILRGHDPWYLVPGGPGGSFSLHAYGPLYNVLALPTLAGPLGPKLLFAASYWAFVVHLVWNVAPRGGMPPWARLLLALWLSGPFVWLELAYFGHFDVLVGLLCVAAVENRQRGRWRRSAAWLAAGVLLKYFPALLAPFLAVEEGKPRWRYTATAGGLSIAGIAAAWMIWGNSVFYPFHLALFRDSDFLSIFRFLRGFYSPIGRDTLFFSPDQYATPILLFALYKAWQWVMRTGFETTGAVVLAAAITLAFYKVGFPQYYMVLFVLSAYWFAHDYARIQFRLLPAIATAACFSLIAWFDGKVATVEFQDVLDWIGLPMFALMLGLIAAIMATGPRTPQAQAESSRAG